MNRNADYNGLLAVNKPAGMTSHDVVDEIRKLAGIKKVGHTGTLDPLAEGLLVLCLGNGTKITRFLSDMDKTYEASITLGLRSTTYDAEGLKEGAEPSKVPELTHDDIMKVLSGFEGQIRQQVPPYSAIKVEGEKLYKRARAGKEIDLPVREVNIKKITLDDFMSPVLKITVDCGKGTYIRSLAHDIGEKIGCGAYLSKLNRTRIGKFRLGQAHRIEDVERAVSESKFNDILIPLAQGLDFQTVQVTDEFSREVLTGRPLRQADVVKWDGAFDVGARVMLRSESGRVLAIGTACLASVDWQKQTNGKLFTYDRVLN